MILFSVLSCFTQAETVFKIMDSDKKIWAARSDFFSFHSCYEKSYTLYTQLKYGLPTLSKEAKDKIQIDFRPKQGLPRYIGRYIGLSVGIDELIKITNPTPAMISAYKLSACAIKKANEIEVNDARMISFALGIIEDEAKGYPNLEKSFKIHAKKGFFDMNKFVELTNAISTMQCDISFEEAHRTHRMYVKSNFLNGKGLASSYMTELKNSCLLATSRAMPLEFEREIKKRLKDK